MMCRRGLHRRECRPVGAPLRIQVSREPRSSYTPNNSKLESLHVQKLTLVTSTEVLLSP